MNILIFDTETTGLPLWKEPSEDPAQPHLVQLAAILVDQETKEEKVVLDVIIKPNGWTWDENNEAFKVHGITFERAMDEGIPEEEALEQYLDLYRQCKLRVAFSTTFDNRIIRILLKRYQPDLISDEEWKNPDLYYCTMVNYSKVFGGKWPKLVDAYQHLIGKPLEGAHNAMNDARACMEIFWKLQELQKAGAA